MHTIYNNRFGKDSVIIHPGEYYASKEDKIISTILGSCVSACMMDFENNVFGMNHFMLPGRISDKEDYVSSETGRYGMYAMELLIGELLKAGAHRKNFQAKIFGGGKVLRFRHSDGDIPSSNILFAKTFFQKEKIHVISEDVGGDYGRKILFFSRTGRVLSKKVPIRDNSAVFDEEDRYKCNLFKKKAAEQEITLF
ncbi:MAG: hypothetical protein ACE5GM_00465 [bacterium]